jgi:hypothetical protein
LRKIIFGKKNDLFGIFIIKKINMAKIVRLTEQDLVRLVNKVIKEQTGDRDPKRIAFFDGLAKQISSKIVGKTFPFGKIGVLDNTSILVQKYMDRNQAINRTQYPVNELNLFFAIRRVQEDLYPNEKKGTRVWTGAIQVSAKFINGKLSSNPSVELWGMRNGDIDFSRTAMTPSRPWTWDMVGGADLWSKAANPPNNLK